MKYLWCFSLILLAVLPNSTPILTKVACSVSGNGTCADPFCYLTPVNQSVNAVNFGCGQLTRPLNKINIRQQFYFKVFREFIPVNIFPDVEYCSFMRKKDKSSYFYSILKVVNKNVPGLIHQCPYQGKELQIRNLAPSSSDIALWITGEYKVVYTFWDDKDNRIFRVSGMGVLKRN